MNPNMQRLNQVAQMMKGFQNPKQAVLQMAKNSNNPMLNNLIQMANNGENKKIEEFGRNFFKEKGIDLDQEMANLQNIMNTIHR